MPEHPADVGQEAHVEHAIRFVEHQELEPGHLRVGHPEVIEEAAGRGDDDVDAAAERVLLRPHADPAEDGGAAERRVHGQIVEIGEHLGGELTGRRQHQRPGRPARPIHQLVEDRQQERRGLAAAGGGAAQDVATLETGRDGVVLDGRGPGEPQLLDAQLEAGV